MEIIVIKMGGVASDNLTPVFFEQVAQWQALGKKIVIVHGGGHYISEIFSASWISGNRLKCWL